MIELGKSSELRFHALLDTNRKGQVKVVKISLVNPGEEIRNALETYQGVAKMLALQFVEVNDNGGIILPYTSKQIESTLILEMERFEQIIRIKGRKRKTLYSLMLLVSHDITSSSRKLKKKTRELEHEIIQLKLEIKELLDLVDKMEEIKESFRAPFDAITDLIVSFDQNGNVLIINQASVDWFGRDPRQMVRRKCKNILNQDVMPIIKQVCQSKMTHTIEKVVDNRILDIRYIPITNRKSGASEVVMLAQDITARRQTEETLVKDGRNQGVVIMGGTVRHILNSSLQAILGFSQLGLSNYNWPKETMVKYLRLIERTAQRMKKEINKIGEQKEFKTTRYISVPNTDDCKEILELE